MNAKQVGNALKSKEDGDTIQRVSKCTLYCTYNERGENNAGQ